MLSLLPCLAGAQEAFQHEKDSLRGALEKAEGVEKLRTYSRLTGLYFMESNDDLKKDTLFALYDQMDDEAARQHENSFRGLLRVNKLYVLLNRRAYDEIIRQVPGCLDFMAGHQTWNHYYSVYNTLIRAYIFKGEVGKAIELSDKMYGDAKDRQSNEGMVLALIAMINIYQAQGRAEESEKCCREVIGMLDGKDYMHNRLCAVWFNLCQALFMQKRYDEIPAAAAEFEKANRRSEASAKASIPAIWGNLWGVYARYYAKTGKYDEAETCCNRIDSLIDGAPFRLIVSDVMAEVLNARGKYAEALERIDRAIDIVGDTRSTEANVMRETKIKILSNMKRYEEANELIRFTASVEDSIRTDRYAAQIDRIRTQYEVEKLTKEKEVTGKYLLGAIIGIALLLAGMSGVAVLYRQKNRAYRALVNKGLQWAEMTAGKTTDGAETSVDDEPEEDRQLMEKADRMIQAELLFADPELSLEGLALHLGVSRNVLSHAINRCKHTNFSQFVNEYRIKESIRLMIDPANKELSLKTIFEQTGFNSRTTFYNTFKKQIGISPSDFRKTAHAVGS